MLPEYQDDFFEWDEAKNEHNFAKHGISFQMAVQIFLGSVKEVVVTGGNPPEKRILAIGLIEKREYTVIYTLRHNRIRVISARRSRVNERKKYWESLI
jgi:uncharacterized DUF497 family protein